MSTYDSVLCQQPQVGNEVLALSTVEILASTNVTPCDEPGVELPTSHQLICQGGVCSLGTWKPGANQLND